MTPRSQTKTVRPASHLTKAQQTFLLAALLSATPQQRRALLAPGAQKLTKQQVREALKNTRLKAQTLRSRNSAKKIVLANIRPAMYRATTRYIAKQKLAQNEKVAATVRKEIAAL